MSGTSMDGTDLAYCRINVEDSGKRSFEILQAETVPYSETWRLRLSKLRNQTALVFHKTDRYYGEYIGLLIRAFIEKYQLKVDLIASHGHTIFHQPEQNITTQIGSGAAIYAITQIPVVNDFRAVDVVLGGQGAPLVPVGDQELFGSYDACLNLGGFANISASGKAFDISPCNIVLNRLAREFDQEFDRDGAIAERGYVDYQLLSRLNEIEYYSEPYPKSLGREWINQNFWHLVRESTSSKEDKMKTLCDHVGTQIGRALDELFADVESPKVLVTGGGAFNKTLMDHIRTHSEAELIIPENQLVNYKEALIFAYLGLKRVLGEENVWSSVTGASGNSISGALHGNITKLLSI